MKGKIALITILADDAQKLKKFYQDVMGFEVQADHGQYIEFQSEGVRFAVCGRAFLADATGIAGYKEPKRGHSFELAFPVASPRDVDKIYQELIKKGAKPVKEPSDMPWGQRTGFFADPEGNVHEIFATL
jgi:catechol 2,3-dioxygenase-like lactoylglutathione lyase family enzyme